MSKIYYFIRSNITQKLVVVVAVNNRWVIGYERLHNASIIGMKLVEKTMTKTKLNLILWYLYDQIKHFGQLLSHHLPKTLVFCMLQISYFFMETKFIRKFFMLKSYFRFYMLKRLWYTYRLYNESEEVWPGTTASPKQFISAFLFLIN